jgi:hypothetical protein
MSYTQKRKKESTRKMVLSAMLSALGVVILWFGHFLGDLDLTIAAVACLIVFLSMMEMGIRYSLLIYTVTAVLSLLLVQGTTSFFYAGFLGFYPIIKSYYEKLPFIPSIFLKLVTVNGVLFLFFLAADALFHWENETATWILYVMANICFLLFDYALTRMVTFYYQHLQKRLGIHRFLTNAS